MNVKTLLKGAALLSGIFLFISCTEVVETDYQEFLDGNFSEVLFILNGEAESFSAYAPSDEKVYQDLQLVGYNGSSEAWPNDLLGLNGSLYVVCSGQNAVEKYDYETLDFKDDVYLKNGFNPMTLCPVSSGSMAAIAGYETDEIILIDLEDMSETSSFISVYEEVSLGSSANSETQVNPTDTNATGDNQDRKTTGLASSGTALYASNVRYDTTIRLTDSSGDIVEYGGEETRASGYFREGTLSVFELTGGFTSATLIREINLQTLFAADPSGYDYFPGDGLNPQSLFVLNGKLHIICTGTNGGEARSYTSSEYIPEGYSTGDTVPGTDPDDGVVLIMDITTDPLNPSLESVLEIGGSPVGFRHSLDESREIFYLAGVGGIQSYGYVAETILHGSDDMILAGSSPSSDYYSHILYKNDRLYISDYSHDKLNRIAVSDNGSTAEYDLMDSRSTGDGPGALTYIEY